MLAIRMQRTGRSGHAQFRVVVQDSRFSPPRGRVVSYLGSYNPHTKTANIDSEKASQYLANGAQPSDTVARLFQKEGIKLPGWVKLSEPKSKDVRNPQKRRSTAPAQPEAAADTPAEEQSAAENETSQEVAQEEPAAASDESPAEMPAEPSEASAEPAAEEPTTEAPERNS